MRIIKSAAKLREFLTQLSPNKVVLFITTPQNYSKINLEILKIIITLNKFSGIYITAGRPYNVIAEIMKDAGINTEKVFFIDCVSRMYLAPKGIALARPGTEMTEECLYLSSPSNLTELGIALSQALSTVAYPENKFIFVDSLSMLLIYNPEDTVIKFIHFLMTRVKLFGLIGIIMVMERGFKRELLATLYELCDEVVEVRI